MAGRDRDNGSRSQWRLAMDHGEESRRDGGSRRDVGGRTV